jgi:hypothetical protein
MLIHMMMALLGGESFFLKYVILGTKNLKFYSDYKKHIFL